MMTKLPRRQVLHLTAGAVVFSATSPIARAQTDMTRPNSEKPVRPLAERLAAYAMACATTISTQRPSNESNRM